MKAPQVRVTPLVVRELSLSPTIFWKEGSTTGRKKKISPKKKIKTKIETHTHTHIQYFHHLSRTFYKQTTSPNQMIQMVSGFSFWFLLVFCHFCRCLVRLHQGTDPSTATWSCSAVTQKDASTTQSCRRKPQWCRWKFWVAGKNHLCVFFVMMVRNLKFI